MASSMTKIQTKTKKARIEEGETKYIVEHNGKDLTFLHPSYGPDTYFNVRDLIQNAGLILPTMAETASLVHTAFNSEDKYSQEIKSIVKNRWLWTFDKNLYAQKGVYIYPEEISNGKDLKESELVRKLEDGDKSIRFVPFGFQTEYMTPKELAKNAYIRALAGNEGAEKLAEVVDKFKDKAYLWALKSVDAPLTRVSALLSGWGFGHGLDVYGDDFGDVRDGLAFGVRKGGIGTVGSD